MPFLRPGLGALHRQALDDMQASPLRWAVGRVLAWAVANLTNGHYGYLDWISRQAVPFTATAEYLEAWAGLIGILRKPAAPATGTASWSGVPGTVLPAGTAAARPDGVRYLLAADSAAGADGTLSCTVAAEMPGAAGNAPAGTQLSLAQSVAGINGAGVSGLLAAGADPEDDDSLRGRMLQRYAAPPQGGAATDYLEWARAVPGVTRAWVRPMGAGAGTVVVYTMWDAAEAAHGGFPQGTDGVASAEPRDAAATGDQAAVANSIFPLRPVTALVYSVSPVALPIDFALHPSAPVPAAAQGAVLGAIDAVFLALSSPLGAELETGPFQAAIAAVPGMPAFTMVSPAGPIQPGIGRLPVRGAVAYA